MCRSGTGEFETVTEQADRNGDGFIDPIVDDRSVLTACNLKAIYCFNEKTTWQLPSVYPQRVRGSGLRTGGRTASHSALGKRRAGL